MTTPTAAEPSVPTPFEAIRDRLTSGNWHPSEYDVGSKSAVRWYEKISARALDALTEAGYSLVRLWTCCTHCGWCNVEGQHANPCDAGCNRPSANAGSDGAS